MALSKPILRTDGVTATYHAIQQIVVDYVNNRTAVILRSFLSQVIAETPGGAALAGSDEFEFIGNPGLADARDWAYAQIIQQSKWSGSILVSDVVV